MVAARLLKQIMWSANVVVVVAVVAVVVTGNVSYHPYEGLSVNVEEQQRLVQHLGPTNKVNYSTTRSCTGMCTAHHTATYENIVFRA